MKRMTFIAAIKDYFGPNPDGVPLLNELKALTSEDRAWFRANLATVGYEIVETNA